MQQAALHVEDGGRIIYVASSTAAFPVPGMAVYDGSKLICEWAALIGERRCYTNVSS